MYKKNFDHVSKEAYFGHYKEVSGWLQWRVSVDGVSGGGLWRRQGRAQLLRGAGRKNKGAVLWSHATLECCTKHFWEGSWGGAVLVPPGGAVLVPPGRLLAGKHDDREGCHIAAISSSLLAVHRQATKGNPNYYLTYGNGKSAARMVDHLRSNGAHRFHNYARQPK